MQLSSSKSTRRGRTFTGCYNCRARKVKCNEAVPECGPCQKRSIICSGYQSKLVWVTSDPKSYQPNGRRFIQSEFTWNNAAVMSSTELDYFVSLCDAAQYVRNFTVEWSPESGVPFGAFPSKDNCLQFAPCPTKLTRSLIYGTPLRDDEAFLFQHYVNHVASIMMPYEDSRNPWQTSYPAVALYYMSQDQRCLYKGLLAQAAFNLAHLGCGQETMLDLATKYYTSAMEELRASLMEQQNDYGTFVASIMTLLFVEVYSGTSRSWRSHFDGAWRFVESQQAIQPWATSIFAESSMQSLCLIKIVNDTSSVHEIPATVDYATALDQERLVSSISTCSSFGFTIGATGILMNCIADITRFASELGAGISIQSLDDGAHDLLVRLDHCREMSAHNTLSESDSKTSNGKMALYHLNAFTAATYIYLYQALFAAPPRRVKQFVAEFFHNIKEFFGLGDGNFSLWPAFIAATAAYEPSDMEAAKTWMKSASRVGIGSRSKVQAVIEKVWRRREIAAFEGGQDVGSIFVDWRFVMREPDLDILLV